MQHNVHFKASNPASRRDLRPISTIGYPQTPTKVFAVLTVPRRIRAGFSDRVLSERQEGDNREDYAREYQTLIQVREAQFHSLLLRYGMQRMGLPGTDEERKRSEFFKGSLVQAKRALKAIGRGDFFEFDSNDISKMRKPSRR